jgi:hypothetical protein
MTTSRLRWTAWTPGTLLCLLSATLAAQAPEFSGTWRLNKAASQIVAGVGLDGLGASGAPPTVYLTHAANGSVLMGSDVNESQARLYRIGGSSTLPPPKVGGSPSPITSRVEGRRLLSEGSGFKEELALSADGRTLTIAVTRDAGTSTLVYTRMDGVDPCTEWVEPCRPEGTPRARPR